MFYHFSFHGSCFKRLWLLLQVREANYVAFRKVIQGLLLEHQLKNFLKVKHHTCVTFIIQCTITVTINISIYHINVLFK